MSEEFEPYILGMFCNWCTYAAADAAGTSRMQRPANLRVIRVMCSGRVDPTFVLKAIAEGADGVLICGCHPGDCHYLEGNLKTERKIPIIRKLLAQFGINPKRVRLEWISASEAIELTELVTEFVKEIKELGPNPLKNKKKELKK
ncbi:MAG: hydrogenase iron-sulfur subunit [Promethearchaeota archaeon]|nr:MAG: hydrogenase iron-sulfur subunit [Candidatus Lokiarchaeota archaeon]